MVVQYMDFASKKTKDEMDETEIINYRFKSLIASIIGIISLISLGLIPRRLATGRFIKWTNLLLIVQKFVHLKF